MKEHPIPFSAPLVTEILAGRKTVTRRICKPQPSPEVAARGEPREVCPGVDALRGVWGFPAFDGKVAAVRTADTVRCRYGTAGDKLWVREPHWYVPASAYRCSREDDGSQVPHRVSPDGGQWAVYRAGWTRCAPSCRARPPMHMHRWASRIDLLVKSVRLERLQAITEADVLAEGVTPDPKLGAIQTFAVLWNTLNADRGYPYKANPWVWRVEFAMMGPA